MKVRFCKEFTRAGENYLGQSEVTDMNLEKYIRGVCGGGEPPEGGSSLPPGYFEVGAKDHEVQ